MSEPDLALEAASIAIWHMISTMRPSRERQPWFALADYERDQTRRMAEVAIEAWKAVGGQ